MKSKLHSKALLALIMAGSVTSALAANNQPYFAVEGSYLNPDNARLNNNGYGLNLLLGLPAGDYLAGELGLFASRTDHKFATSFDKQLGAGLDLAVYPFKRSSSFSPFLLIGSGVQYDDRPVHQRGYSFINAGGGFLMDVTKTLALRVDAKRYRINDNDLVPGRQQLWDTRINAGIQMAFGEDPVVAVAPPPPVVPTAPADTDGDGVPDSIDQCPGTPRGVVVNAVGCPLPVPPKDSDGDGVNDNLDACPNTPRGLKVDSRGCAIKAAKVVLHDINFEFNSSRLTGASKTSLDNVVEGLRGQPSMKLLVEGHTDSVGSNVFNLKLSKQRAASARAYLIEQGIVGSRLTSTGFGESQPMASNKTKDGRAENRRVEFKVTEQ